MGVLSASLYPYHYDVYLSLYIYVNENINFVNMLFGFDQGILGYYGTFKEI